SAASTARPREILGSRFTRRRISIIREQLAGRSEQPLRDAAIRISRHRDQRRERRRFEDRPFEQALQTHLLGLRENEGLDAHLTVRVLDRAHTARTQHEAELRHGEKLLSLRWEFPVSVVKLRAHIGKRTYVLRLRDAAVRLQP